LIKLPTAGKFMKEKKVIIGGTGERLGVQGEGPF